MIHSEFVINKSYRGLNPVQFGYESCKPFHDFGPAVRNHWLLHYVKSGCGVFQRDGKTYGVGPGEIFVIPPGIRTYYKADGDNPWEYIWIGFTCEGEPPVSLEPVISCKAAGAIFEKMKRCEAFDNGKSAFLSGMLWQLVGTLLENDNLSSGCSGYVEKAISYMNTEYTRGITVSEIAGALNLNRSYFSTLFKNQLGVTPQEYLLNLRLEKAVEIMTEHGGTPTLAALSTGYTDIYQFSKVFKAKYGVSPREYIKRTGE